MMKLPAIAVALTLAALPCLADEAAEFKADLRYCEAYADARAQSTGSPSAKAAAIGTVANILGAVIGGRDPSYAISGGAQSTIHGLGNDARMAEWKRQGLIESCLRERQNAKRAR